MKRRSFFSAPHGAIFLLMNVLAIALLVAGVLVITLAARQVRAVSYVFFGLGTVLFIYCAVFDVKAGRRAYLALAEKNKFIKRYREDYEWRTLVFATGSSLLTLVMAGYYFALSLASASLWYIALAVYLFVLLLTRTGVLLSRRIGVRRGEDGARLALRDAKNYIGSGGMLVLMQLAFTGVLVLTVLRNFHHSYVGLTIYVAALYCFLKVAFAVVNFFRAHRREDLTVRSLRSVNAADALVSIVSLQAAMLDVFENGASEIDSALFNAATGGVVSALVLALGSFMIIEGSRKLGRRQG